mmetsp:Transcript_23876/g.36281  ORF Transcript_23876/g.36281 Transcript_23876/m.36281 type:complete len:245 (-) Transcript_23876:1437-2171(-)|eukprot:CAMPEP_0178932816 /NCGR_PEP_ID=MMETSP0786-20121207/22867_1 /TAXON_ID=186022 /ORGANISM="Thalassionema frauenfeldii, Strain CCMP 1798" /LENGTH=244 /DNA_ID=CAMNT_0020610229 /DNA_START=281 /DNA_END=1015 /DNA_ORIENTATION=+
MKKLQVEVATLSSEMDMSVVKFGSLGFHNQEDASAYVTKTPGAENFDLITDIYHFNMLMQKEMHGDGEFLKQLKTVRKLGLRSTHEAISLTSFLAPIPILFHDPDKGLPSRDESAFSRFKKITTWEEADERLKASIQTVRSGLEEAINLEILTTSPAHTICLLSVSNTMSNLEGLCTLLTLALDSLHHTVYHPTKPFIWRHNWGQPTLPNVTSELALEYQRAYSRQIAQNLLRSFGMGFARLKM